MSDPYQDLLNEMMALIYKYSLDDVKNSLEWCVLQIEQDLEEEGW